MKRFSSMMKPAIWLVTSLFPLFLVGGCLDSLLTVGSHERAVTATDMQCFMVADINDENGVDILYLVNKLDDNIATNISPVGTNLGAGNNGVEAIAFDPFDKVLYTSNAGTPGAQGGQIGTVDLTDGSATLGQVVNLAMTIGRGDGAAGNNIPFTDVDGLAFDPDQEDVFFGTARRAGSEDLLIQIDKAAGAHIPGAFNGDDYVVIERIVDAVNGDTIDVDDIAIDRDGTLFAVTNNGAAGGNSHLITIDKTDGSITVVGPTDDENGVRINDIEGLAFDVEGELWGSAGGGNALYTIDKTTGLTGNAIPLPTTPPNTYEDFEGLDCFTGTWPPDVAPGPDAGTDPGTDAGGGPGPDPGDEISVVGGGCSAGGGPLGVGLAFVLGFLALCFWRRRTGSSRERISRTALLIAILAGSLTAVSSTAEAQVTQDFTIERFRISLDRAGILDSEWGRTIGHLNWDLGLWIGLADDPLVIKMGDEEDSGERIGRLLEHRVGGHLVGTIGIDTWLQIGAEIPVVVSQEQGDFDFPGIGMGGAITRGGIGDIRIVPKVRLLRSDKHVVDLAIIPAVTLPTSSSSEYIGEDGFSFAPELAVSRAFGAIRVVSNVGYRARPNQDLFNLSVADEIFVRVGAGYRLAENGGPPLGFDLGLALASKAADFLDKPSTNPAELLGAVNYLFTEPLLGFAGGGIGLNEGFGTPDFRVLVGLRFQSVKPREERRIEIPPPPPKPEPKCGANDRDCDTVPDPPPMPRTPVAGPPDQPADPAQPAEPAPPADPAPALIEPWPGQPPNTDYCPDVPGTPEFHGCPEPTIVVNPCDSISVSPAITFAKGEDALMPVSTVTLDELAKVLAAQHADAKISIDVGTGQADKDLAERRASAVQSYLIGKGMNPANLSVVGYGTPGEPAADGDPAAGQQAVTTDESAYPVSFKMACPEKEAPECKNLELNKKIEFEVNSDVIRQSSLDMLKRDVVWVLQAHPDVRMAVEGHTSTEGRRAYNMKLSTRRAKSVKKYLVDQGITGDRIKSVGFGPNRPLVTPDDTEEKREQNRRIEFRITAGGNCKPCEKLEVGKIQFEFNSNVLKIESNPQLERVAAQLKERPALHLRIEGHTSTEGSVWANQKLSNRRAQAVYQYLTDPARGGIAKSRLKFKGVGEKQPLIKPDNTDEEKEINRRVEFVITKGGECAPTDGAPAATP